MSHVALEREKELNNVAMQVVRITQKARLVIPVFYVQMTVPIVKTGLNGQIAVLHAAQEPKHELNHVVMQVVPIIPRAELVTLMLHVLQTAPHAKIGLTGAIAV